MRLYVGNIPYSTTEDDLRQHFGRFGDLTRCQVVTDRDTGRGRGFAFVEFIQQQDAQRAIDELNRTEFQGRMLVVNIAREREQRGGGGDRGDRREHRGRR